MDHLKEMRGLLREFVEYLPFPEQRRRVEEALAESQGDHQPVGEIQRWFIDQWYATDTSQAGWHVGVKLYDHKTDLPAGTKLYPVANIGVCVMPPSPYMPDVEPSSMSDYERGEAQGRCDMWAEVKRLNTPRPSFDTMVKR